jgi:hypothetical protein
MAYKKIEEDEQGTPNKGHKFGVLFPNDNYYFADAVRTNEAGQTEFYCVHKTHSRYGKITPLGLVVDYHPSMSLEDFKKLPGQQGEAKTT